MGAVRGGRRAVCEPPHHRQVDLNHHIIVLGTDLAWRYTIGRRGSGDGEFDDPMGIATHGGELYVVDRNNHRVQARRPRPAAPRPARHAPPRLSRQVFAPDRHGRMRFACAFGDRGDARGSSRVLST
jgi:hypothetical protein